MSKGRTVRKCHGRRDAKSALRQLVELIHAADDAWHIVCAAVHELKLLRNFALEDGGANLIGTANGTGVGGRAECRIQVVAGGDGTGRVLQTYGVHGPDVAVGAFLHAVFEHRCAAVAPAPDAANVATLVTNAVDGAGEEAVADGGGRLQTVPHDTAGIVAPDVERGRDGATLNQVGAAGKTNEACRVLLIANDGSCHGEILDGGTIDVAEEGCALILHAVDGGRDGMALTEEGAAESFARRVSRHITARLIHADISRQLHVLTAVAVAEADTLGKYIPFDSRVDGEGIAGRAVAREHTHSFVRHYLLARDVAGRGYGLRAVKHELLAVGKSDAIQVK